MSIEFTLPAWLAEPETTIYVPLAVLRKHALTNFDVWDEERRPIPVLNTIRNGDISAETLLALARRVAAARRINLRPANKFSRLFGVIARSPVPEARRKREAVERACSCFGWRWRRLTAESVLAGVLEDLTEGFQLLVPRRRSGRRRRRTRSPGAHLRPRGRISRAAPVGGALVVGQRLVEPLRRG
jgi:hypothetical protein